MRIAVQSWVRVFAGFAVLAGGAFVAVSVAHAEGGAVYRWKTADGTIAFTDDAKRVPERYQGTAETVDRGMLTDYGRYTETDRSAHDDYARRLTERLDALRAASAVSEDAVGREESPPQGELAPTIGVSPQRDVYRRQFTRDDNTSYWRYYDRQATVAPSLPVDPNDPHPVLTEPQRVSVPGQTVTETVTVTRQGDRVLSVTRPHSTYHKSTWPSLTDLTQ